MVQFLGGRIKDQEGDSYHISALACKVQTIEWRHVVPNSKSNSLSYLGVAHSDQSLIAAAFGFTNAAPPGRCSHSLNTRAVQFAQMGSDMRSVIF